MKGKNNSQGFENTKAAWFRVQCSTVQKTRQGGIQLVERAQRFGRVLGSCWRTHHCGAGERRRCLGVDLVFPFLADEGFRI